MQAQAQKMFAVKLNEKVYNFFNEIILCFFMRSSSSSSIINKALLQSNNGKQNKCATCNEADNNNNNNNTKTAYKKNGLKREQDEHKLESTRNNYWLWHAENKIPF